jgi:peptide deformylase
VSVVEIAQVGAPVLRRRAAEVLPEELHSPEVQQLIDDLIETRRAAGGAGLAANQISELKRIAVVEVDDAARRRYPYKPAFPLTVIVNPVIEPLTDETLLVNEGCLSVPGLRGDVPRRTRIRVHYLDREGEPRDVVAEGLTAGTFQHEVDHLDGILFLDRIADPRSFSTWEEFERHHRDDFLRRARRWIPEGAEA